MEIPRASPTLPWTPQLDLSPDLQLKAAGRKHAEEPRVCLCLPSPFFLGDKQQRHNPMVSYLSVSFAPMLVAQRAGWDVCHMVPKPCSQPKNIPHHALPPCAVRSAPTWGSLTSSSRFLPSTQADLSKKMAPALFLHPYALYTLPPLQLPPSRGCCSWAGGGPGAVGLSLAPSFLAFWEGFWLWSICGALSALKATAKQSKKIIKNYIYIYV